MAERFRIYFNGHGRYPVSVDCGTPKTEQNFTQLHCLVSTHSHYDPTTQPKFWLECVGRLEVYANGAATIYPG